MRHSDVGGELVAATESPTCLMTCGPACARFHCSEYSSLPDCGELAAMAALLSDASRAICPPSREASPPARGVWKYRFLRPRCKKKSCVRLLSSCILYVYIFFLMRAVRCLLSTYYFRYLAAISGGIAVIFTRGRFYRAFGRFFLLVFASVGNVT